MTYDKWLEEIKEVALTQFNFSPKGITNTDWSAFKPYFDDGYTPKDALSEDFSNA